MTRQITLLDPDGQRARKTADSLRRLLTRANILAKVTEITCYLEIARQGYSHATPAILLDNQVVISGQTIAEKHLFVLVNQILKRPGDQDLQTDKKG